GALNLQTMAGTSAVLRCWQNFLISSQVRSGLLNSEAAAAPLTHCAPARRANAASQLIPFAAMQALIAMRRRGRWPRVTGFRHAVAQAPYFAASPHGLPGSWAIQAMFAARSSVVG